MTSVPMKSIQWCCLSLLAVLSGSAEAGWNFESRARQAEQPRNDEHVIALVTLHNVRQLSGEERERFLAGGFMETYRPAFEFRVEFVEVLRGTPPKRPLDVPFSYVQLFEPPFQPYHSGRKEQREMLLEGHKAVAWIRSGRDAKNPSLTVWLVSSFETDDRAKVWRKRTALWNMPDAEDRRQALLAGCRNAVPEFQEYCCRRLANWEREKPDEYAAEQLEPSSALPVIWEVFVNPTTPQEVLGTCDEILLGTSPGWRTHPARYDVMVGALRRHCDASVTPFDSQTDHDLFAAKLTVLSHFPDRTRQTWRLFQEIIDSEVKPDRYCRQTLSHLSHLYRPHTADPQQRQCNVEIWGRLSKEFADPQSNLAFSAAWAIEAIADQYSYVGGLPDYVATILDAETDHLPVNTRVRVLDWIKRVKEEIAERRSIAQVVEQKRREGYTDLTIPVKSQVGRKLVFVTHLGRTWRNDQPFGYTVWTTWSAWQNTVWLETRPEWSRGGKAYVVCTGTLAERDDVPVFQLEPQKPFGVGLPVPPGYDPQDIRRRYVIDNISWELVE